jgi:hypothetical protein
MGFEPEPLPLFSTQGTYEFIGVPLWQINCFSSIGAGQII